MSKAFDMELFLAGALTGSHSTRQRHLRQAKTIQTAIAERWQRDNPWTWQEKHLRWFSNRKPKKKRSNALLLSFDSCANRKADEEKMAICTDVEIYQQT